jgi:hypothetical protein
LLESWLGPELDKADLLVLPLRGTANARSIVDGELAWLRPWPVRVMFDNIDASFVEAACAIVADPSAKRRAFRRKYNLTDARNGERAALWHLLERAQNTAKPIETVAFDLPDILFALSDADMRVLYPRCRVNSRTDEFPGWEVVTDRYNAWCEKIRSSQPDSKRPSLAAFFADELGCKKDRLQARACELAHRGEFVEPEYSVSTVLEHAPGLTEVLGSPRERDL